MLPTFPNFKPLTLDDKQDYERLVANYPPISDISFPTLHIWWNLEDRLTLSALNGNLVISFNLAFDTENSGYSLIGRSDVDASVQVIFDHLSEKKQPVKLVHVPEFVIAQLKNKTKFKLTEESDYNEYIIDSQHLAAMAGTPHRITRRKVRRFWQGMEGSNVEVRALDLTLSEVRTELYEAVLQWEATKPNENDPDHTEYAAIKKTLDHAAHLGIQQLGFYVDDTLRGILLYHKTHDDNSYILHHLKVDYSIPYIFDYVTHHIADKAVRDGVQFLNMEMDLGIAGLREHKMGLRPVSFFRKYTIEPSH